MWVLWKTRNDHVFDNKIVPNPTVVIHKMVSMLRQWSPMVKQKEKRQVDEAIAKMLEALSKAK